MFERLIIWGIVHDVCPTGTKRTQWGITWIVFSSIIHLKLLSKFTSKPAEICIGISLYFPEQKPNKFQKEQYFFIYEG